MHVSLVVWAATLVGLAAILAVDLLVVGRRPHIPSPRECAVWVGVYLALAALFGVAVIAGYGPRYGGQFFAGWLTEYSLSVDNLFVFMIVMARFRTPRAYQQKALMIGIVVALVMRAGFIVAGAAALHRLEWVFYFFGAFLVYTAVHVGTSGDMESTDVKENVLVRLARRILPVTADADGPQLVVRRDGRRMVTPMAIVVLALGTTDLVFALDSIPAIFGLTQESYLVLASNIFALMGLRQLYFLLGGLLGRLVYLPIGLSVVLGFIGVKLILEALHDNNLPFVNGGHPVSWAPAVPIWLSLGLIVGVLAVATGASLAAARRGNPRAVSATAAVRAASGDLDPAGSDSGGAAASATAGEIAPVGEIAAGGEAAGAEGPAGGAVPGDAGGRDAGAGQDAGPPDPERRPGRRRNRRRVRR